MNQGFVWLTLFSFMWLNDASAYGGGGGGSSTCIGPVFSQHMPIKEATVPVLSDFSFMASADTRASSLKATTKNWEIPLSVTEIAGGFLAEGHFDEPITEGYVLLRISGETRSGCPRQENWLIKIAPSMPVE